MCNKCAEKRINGGKMKFEEEFKSFTEEQIWVSPACWHNEKDYSVVKDENINDFFIKIKDIQEHCLDKARVKEAIDKMRKVFEDGDGNYWWSEEKINDLEKELGL